MNCRCQLLVFWEKIVACFEGHVACRIYPLEGLGTGRSDISLQREVTLTSM